ncbi:MAG: DUF1565 domain-containing protein [Fibrella sp.]|nr:DUF1565 domain-containing protein [Armatimonadota bacterium]
MNQNIPRVIFGVLSLFILVATLAPQMARGLSETFYVATDGNDSTGDGSVAKPWKTLAYAADNVPPGNAIHVKAGDYLETRPVKLAVGVDLRGAGANRTVIRAGLDASYLITLISPSNATGNQDISGFTIDGNDKTLRGGVLVENVNNVSLHHVNFLRCRESGSTFVDSSSRDWNKPPDKYVTGSKIYDCKYTNCASIPFKKADGSAAGMSGNLQLGGLDGAEVYNIEIEDIASPGTEDGYGIKFAAGGYFKNLKIHDCKIKVNETAKAWISNFCVELWNVGPGCEIYRVNANTVFSLVNQKSFDQKVANTQNLKVHDCRIINNRPGGSNNEAIEAYLSGLEIYGNYIENASIGIAFWGTGHHISVRNNVFANPKKMDNVWGQFPTMGLWLDAGNGTYSDLKIYNNVFDNYGDGVRFNTVNGDASPTGDFDGVDIKNNAFLRASNAIWETSGTQEAGRLRNVTLTYNLKDNAAVWVKNSNAVTPSKNLQGDPGYRGSGSRWDSYYRPSSKSSYCVDKGTNVGLPFSGAAADIGCHEYALITPKLRKP